MEGKTTPLDLALSALVADEVLTQTDGINHFSGFDGMVKAGLEKLAFRADEIDKLIALLKTKRICAGTGRMDCSSDAVITGSFLLWLLDDCPKTWKPDDVDIFTSKHNDVWHFKQAFGDPYKIECGDEYYGYATGHGGKLPSKYSGVLDYSADAERLQYTGTGVVTVYTWNWLDGPKLQLIWVRSDAEQYIAECFDLDPVKVWFDGTTLCTPGDYNFSTRHTDLKNRKVQSYREFDRLLKRCYKYAARGYSFRLPVEVTLPKYDHRMKALYTCDQPFGKDGEHVFHLPQAAYDTLTINTADRAAPPRPVLVRQALLETPARAENTGEDGRKERGKESRPNDRRGGGGGRRSGR